jgi:hypothetical protein
MGIKPRDSMRYYVSCWSSRFPAIGGDESAQLEGDQEEWHPTKLAAEAAMKRLFKTGRFFGGYILDCALADFETIDYLEKKRKS